MVAVGVLAGMVAGCGEGSHHEPRLGERPNEFLVKAGLRYAFELDGTLGESEGAQAWTSADFSGSPLAFMERTSIVLKADDYGSKINGLSARFVELVDSFGGVASLGIITSSLTGKDEVNATYRMLHESGFECWSHGHTHEISDNRYEFRGTNREEQEQSFAQGLELGMQQLGIEFRSFGAPGNGIDATTNLTVEEFSQIAVWLFGDSEGGFPEDRQLMVLPRLMDIESRVGRIKNPTAFSRELDALHAQTPGLEALTLQLHPNRFTETDFVYLEMILAELQQRKAYRFSSPFEWWAWVQDRGRISLTRDDAGGFLLDLSSAEHDHRIQFDGELAPPVFFRETTR